MNVLENRRVDLVDVVHVNRFIGVAYAVSEPVREEILRRLKVGRRALIFWEILGEQVRLEGELFSESLCTGEDKDNRGVLKEFRI